MSSLLLQEGDVIALAGGFLVERRSDGYDLFLWHEQSDKYSTVFVSDRNALELFKFLRVDCRLLETRAQPEMQITSMRCSIKDEHGNEQIVGEWTEETP